ncbi:MAG: TIGR02270 family protein [Rubrivivax sp.]|nr:MAG: TIGR02270 family protein [Rubrivivax sp.]
MANRTGPTNLASPRCARASTSNRPRISSRRPTAGATWAPPAAHCTYCWPAWLRTRAMPTARWPSCGAAPKQVSGRQRCWPADSVPGSNASILPNPMTPDRDPPPVLHAVVQQHAEETAMLRQARAALVRAPHVGLELLGRHDERIEAHLDGLLVAGVAGKALAQQQWLEDESDIGASFTAAVLALRQGDRRWLDELLAASTVADARRRGLMAAFGWVAPETLRGVVQPLLLSSEPRLRQVGIEACRMHLTDPGAGLAGALDSTDAPLRATAWRCAGELGRIDLLGAARQAMSDESPEVVFWAAWAACLLGDRNAALQMLANAAQKPGDLANRALALALIASPFDQAGELARRLSASFAGQSRQVLRSVGLLGDVRFVPWLLDQVDEPATARQAAESLSWITGADLARDSLETLKASLPPPAEDADEEDVIEVDEDADLPWPDPKKLRAWCANNREIQAAAATGTRWFAGAAIGPAAAQQVLRRGHQRMRWLAALWLCVQQPGQPLFPVAAPAARQRARLAAQGGSALA